MSFKQHFSTHIILSNNKIVIQAILAILFCFHLQAQNQSALYQNWLDALINNTPPILPTFSFAGYKNGELNKNIFMELQ